MAAMSAADLDVWFKQQAATQLDTFSETITITATVWQEGVWDGLNAGHYAPGAYRSGTNTKAYNKTWSLGYDTSVFNNDLDSGIGTGLVAESQGVANSVANAVRSAVDKIEATIGNVSFDAKVCHNSCHSNCHGSRGRR